MTDLSLRLTIGLLQGILLILLAPGLVGLLRYLRAELQQRRRRPHVLIFQPYRDLAKLSRKPVVRAQTTSWLFAVTPIILFATYGLLAFFMPIFHQVTLVSADLILIIYILALARFSLCLAGLDAGAPFGGLGGSREMLLYFLSEIGVFLIVTALAIYWKTVRLDLLFSGYSAIGLGKFLSSPELLLLIPAMFILILFETGRIPVDNPATHLELTMSQKAITLEFAGSDLALIEWAEMIKLTFLLTLLVNLFIPYPTLPADLNVVQIIWAAVIYALKMLLSIIVLVVLEAVLPKLRLRAVTRPSLYPIVLSLLVIIYHTITTTLGGSQ